MSFHECSLEEWEQEYGCSNDKPVLKFNPEEGERIYKSWVKDFSYGPLVMAKILSIVKSNGLIKYALVLEYLDKEKWRTVSKSWVSEKTFMRRVKALMKQVDKRFPTGTIWRPVVWEKK